MPAYDAESWLEPTINKLYQALSVANLSPFEIIVINDGSSDHTLRVAQKIAEERKEVIVLTQDNQGRFITRKRGVESAKYERILFVDTRVWLDKGSLAYLSAQISDHPERAVWNGHINVAKKGNLIARFGDALTIIGWRRYFKNPRLISYGLADFDHYPKGTGLFTAPRPTLLAAIEWFEKNTTDIKNSSDDTLLIRHIAEAEKIWLSPEFSATYFARTTLSAFLKHSYFRGQFFVDGFLRKGTRFYYPLIAFLVFTPLILLAALLLPKIMLFGCALWVLIPIASLMLGLSFKDSLSLFVLAPLFILMYGAGIWRAFIRKVYHGKRA